MKLDEVIKVVRQMKSECNFIIEQTGFDGNCFDKIETENISEDERFTIERLEKALDGLTKFSAEIEYISRPISSEGTLRKNSRDRYESSSYEYTSGSRIEYQTYDDFFERNEWKLSRVEHNGENYYIVGDKELNLEGLRVRERRR